ncbi:MAG: hypothetical protein K0S74_184 [Chlamydiales bacterium]|jgi:short-subunit dehydrogenase|nr:hypothetical protein [Chlamydiales bacterium]
MTKQFKKALITGASSGIGYELAKLLASKGIDLLLTGRDRNRLDQLQAELNPLGVSSQIYSFDLGKREDRIALQQLIRTQSPNLVINNAGCGLYGDAILHSLETHSELLDVNVKAVLELTLVAAETLKKQHLSGIILNVSSAAAFLPFPSFATYSASKAFLNQFSLSIDTELQPYNIRVLTACPGQVATKFRERSSRGFPQKEEFYTMSPQLAAVKIWKQIEEKIPLYIFDWRTRWAIRLANNFLPRRLIAYILKKQIDSRHNFGKDKES